MEKKNKIKVAAFAALSILSATAFAENLVPDKPSKGPNIWCTWGIQNGIGGEQAEKVRETVKREIAFEGDQGGGADFARSCINEDLIFGENGWANFWPEIRKDVYMLLDDGWDVPYNTPAKNPTHSARSNLTRKNSRLARAIPRRGSKHSTKC